MFEKKIIALFCLLACVAAQQPGTANLIVHKTLLTPHIISAKPLNVSIQLFNVGDGAAFEVQVQDVWPKDTFSVTPGSASAKWDKIPAGHNVTYVYSVVPSLAGYFDTERARVEYRQAPKGAVQAGHSSSAGTIFVEDFALAERRLAPRHKEWAAFVFLCGLSVLAPYSMYSRLAAPHRADKTKKRDIAIADLREAEQKQKQAHFEMDTDLMAVWDFACEVGVMISNGLNWDG